MWRIIQTIYPIWHIDATGGIFKSIANQGKPLLYTIACHDTQKKKKFR